MGDHSAVVLIDGRPHVFYRGLQTLRHAYYNGLFWAFETLDGEGGPHGRTNANVGAFNAVVLYGGRPHVFYQDATNRNLRHAYFTGTAWGFETLDGAGGPNGRIVADTGLTNAAVSNWGRPEVFYYDRTGGNLRHAWFG